MQRIDPLDVSDIDGAVARQPARRNTSHHPFNSNADIAATTPQPRRLPTSRLTNPLEPDYSLPTFVPAPETESSKPARDVLFTLEQPPRRVSATRDLMDWSDVTQAESRSRELLRRPTATRNLMAVADINEKPGLGIGGRPVRCSDPLAPSYRDLDGGAYGAVPAKIPKPGQTFPRSPFEAFGLITADISASGPRTTEYPKHLIKTRETNKTADISGAQAGTMPTSGPRLWARDPDNPHKPPRDPSKVPEKETNRVVDIDGAVSGTGGIRETALAPMYRRQHQARALTNAPAARAAIAAARQTSQSAEAKAVDVAAVEALS